MTEAEKQIVDFAADVLKRLDNWNNGKLPHDLASDLCLARVRMGRISESAKNEVK